MQFPIAVIAAVATYVAAAPAPGYGGAAEVAANAGYKAATNTGYAAAQTGYKAAASSSSSTGPSLARKIWSAVTYVPRKVGACVGACVNDVGGVVEEVGVQAGGAIVGVKDGVHAAVEVGAHEAHVGRVGYVKDKHAEIDAIKAAAEKQRAADKAIEEARLAKLQIEHKEKKHANEAAWAAIERAEAERQAALDALAKGHLHDDQVAWEAKLAEYNKFENSKEGAAARFSKSQADAKAAEEARIKAILASRDQHYPKPPCVGEGCKI